MNSSASSTGTSLSIPLAVERVLRPHQVEAVKFLWTKLVEEGLLPMAKATLSATPEQRKLLYSEIYGAIIGHSMGLGKTITSITFVFLLQALISRIVWPTWSPLPTPTPLTAKAGAVEETASTFAHSLRVVVITRKSCLLHWTHTLLEWGSRTSPFQASVEGRSEAGLGLPQTMEVFTWSEDVEPVKDEETSSTTENSSSSPPTSSVWKRRMDALCRFYARGGFLVMSYEAFLLFSKVEMSTLWSAAGGRQACCVSSLLDQIREPLPLASSADSPLSSAQIFGSVDLLILDEAHRLRRESDKIVQALRHHLSHVQLRVALSGAPFQNHLEEYNLMQSMVTGCYMNRQRFYKAFIQPIERGQCTDCTYQEFTEMQQCVTALRHYFASTVHHVGSEVLESELPPRKEIVLVFDLSPQQSELYRRILHHFNSIPAGATSSTLMLHHHVSHISCHPSLVRLPSSPSNPPSDHRSSEENDGFPQASSAHHPPSMLPVEELVEEEDDGGQKEEAAPAFDLLPAESDLTCSPKLLFALELINHIINNLQEKVVLFSLYTAHLRLIAHLLWARYGIRAPVFSGELRDEEREELIQELSASSLTDSFAPILKKRHLESSKACHVLLCSTRAGGEGINLTAANHCIVFSVSWNPTDDIQAAARIYRYGQTRPVWIYRLASYGTTEQVVFCYALRKRWLQKKIEDERDPTRQEVHSSRDYLKYPCDASLPLPESLTTLHHQYADRRAEWKDQECQFWLRWCERKCPDVAHVLQAVPSLLPTLRNVIKHAFLLRDDSGEAIKAVGKRFSVDWEKVKALRLEGPPRPQPAADHYAAVAVPLDSPAAVNPLSFPLVKRCERGLAYRAKQAAVRCLLGIRRVTSGENSVPSTVESLKALEAQLLALLNPLLLAATQTVSRWRLAQRQSQRSEQVEEYFALMTEPVDNLVEWFLLAYQLGVAVLMKHYLDPQHHFAARNTLLQQLRDMNRSQRQISGRAVLPRSLSQALGLHPYWLLEGLTSVEQMYLATEWILPRPLVPHLFFMGVTEVWCLAAASLGHTNGPSAASPKGGSEPLFTAQRFTSLLEGIMGLVGGMKKNTENSLGSRWSEEGMKWYRGHPSLVARYPGIGMKDGGFDKSLFNGSLEALLAFLEEEWPLFAGFRRPPLPFSLGREEDVHANGLAVARRRCSPPMYTPGPLFPVEEVIGRLRLRKVSRFFKGDASAEDAPSDLIPGQSTTMFVCPRCAHGRLTMHREMSANEHDGGRDPSMHDGAGGEASRYRFSFCPSCHFDVVSSLKTDPSTHHHATVYQISVVCHLLEVFNIAETLLLPSAPAADSADAVLQILATTPIHRSPQQHWVDSCLRDGASVWCSMPSHAAAVEVGSLLRLQSGAGDVGELQRLLCANSKWLWSENIKEHLRDLMMRVYQDQLTRLMPDVIDGLGIHSGFSASEVASKQHPLLAFTSVPLVLLPLALYASAYAIHIHYAHELLNWAVSDANGTEATEGVSNYIGGEPSPLFEVHCASRTTSHHVTLLQCACDGLVKLLYIEKLLRHPVVDPPSTVTEEEQESPTLTAAALVDRQMQPTCKRRSGSRDAFDTSSSSSNASQSFAVPPSPDKTDSDSEVEDENIVSASDTSSFSSMYTSDRSSFVEESEEAHHSTAHHSPSHSKEITADLSRRVRRQEKNRLNDGTIGESRAATVNASMRLCAALQQRREAHSIPQLQNVDAVEKKGPSCGSSSLRGRGEDRCLQQRITLYWTSFCEVYGTAQADKAAVAIKTTLVELTADPSHSAASLASADASPPSHLLFPYLAQYAASSQGLSINEALERYLVKLMQISDQVTLI